jgi:hypothetical protein
MKARAILRGAWADILRRFLPAQSFKDPSGNMLLAYLVVLLRGPLEKRTREKTREFNGLSTHLARDLPRFPISSRQSATRKIALPAVLKTRAKVLSS